MTRQPRHSEFPNQFQRQSLALINSLVDLSGSIFFLVEPDMRHRGAVMYDLAPDVEKQYVSTYACMDPLSPEQFADKAVTVVTLDSQIPAQRLKQTLYYQEFMQPHNHRYVADMFFRQQGRIVAVLSMLRQESMGEFTSEELALLRKLQPFLEYSLNSVYIPKRTGERQTISALFQLTEREMDVVELLVSGASNKAIAAELNVGLATVKTHLHHIFDKAEVHSRSELVARVLTATSP